MEYCKVVAECRTHIEGLEKKIQQLEVGCMPDSKPVDSVCAQKDYVKTLPHSFEVEPISDPEEVKESDVVLQDATNVRKLCSSEKQDFSGKTEVLSMLNTQSEVEITDSNIKNIGSTDVNLTSVSKEVVVRSSGSMDGSHALLQDKPSKLHQILNVAMQNALPLPSKENYCGTPSLLLPIVTDSTFLSSEGNVQPLVASVLSSLTQQSFKNVISGIKAATAKKILAAEWNEDGNNNMSSQFHACTEDPFTLSRDDPPTLILPMVIEGELDLGITEPSVSSVAIEAVNDGIVKTISVESCLQEPKKDVLDVEVATSDTMLCPRLPSSSSILAETISRPEEKMCTNFNGVLDVPVLKSINEAEKRSYLPENAPNLEVKLSSRDSMVAEMSMPSKSTSIPVYSSSEAMGSHGIMLEGRSSPMEVEVDQQSGANFIKMTEGGMSEKLSKANTSFQNIGLSVSIKDTADQIVTVDSKSVTSKGNNMLVAKPKIGTSQPEDVESLKGKKLTVKTSFKDHQSDVVTKQCVTSDVAENKAILEKKQATKPKHSKDQAQNKDVSKSNCESGYSRAKESTNGELSLTFRAKGSNAVTAADTSITESKSVADNSTCNVESSAEPFPQHSSRTGALNPKSGGISIPFKATNSAHLDAVEKHTDEMENVKHQLSIPRTGEGPIENCARTSGVKTSTSIPQQNLCLADTDENSIVAETLVRKVVSEYMKSPKPQNVGMLQWPVSRATPLNFSIHEFLFSDGIIKKKSLSTHPLVLPTDILDSLPGSTTTVGSATTSYGGIKPYISPLLVFSSYRSSPNFSSSAKVPLNSITYSNKLDPSRVLCQFELTGTCSDNSCTAQHFRDIQMTNEEISQDLLSYCPSIAGCTEQELLESTLASRMNVDTISGKLSSFSEKFLKKYTGKVSDEDLWKILVYELNKERMKSKRRREVITFDCDSLARSDSKTSPSDHHLGGASVCHNFCLLPKVDSRK